MKHCCFNITSYCNLDCLFCYRIGNDLGEVDTEKAYKYIDYLVTEGCSSINITGGEPLLHSSWKEIIHYCKTKELSVSLSTNGLLLNIHDTALQDINMLCIPLDNSYSANAQQMMRSSYQVNKALKVIKEFIHGGFDFGLRINTVVTKQNIAQLDDIFTIVNYPGIEWKLFELREKGYYYRYPTFNILPLEEVSDVIAHYIQRDKECSIYYSGYIVEDYLLENHPDPLVLNYNGDLFLTKQTEDVFLKNLDVFI